MTGVGVETAGFVIERESKGALLLFCCVGVMGRNEDKGVSDLEFSLATPSQFLGGFLNELSRLANGSDIAHQYLTGSVVLLSRSETYCLVICHHLKRIEIFLMLKNR